MKLIIDISNEDYEFIKNLQSLVISSRGNTKTIQYNVINAIKNGIPYESAASMPIKDEKVLQSVCDTCTKYNDCSESTKNSPNYYICTCRKYKESNK